MDGEVTPEEVAALLEAESARVVDIRDADAFARGHIPGSENVPFHELPDRIESLAGAERIVAVCPHGKASQQAARLIASHEGTDGATVESMAGGLAAWDGDLTADEPEWTGAGGSGAPF